MTLIIRPAAPGDAVAIADLIEEIERYYGGPPGEPLDERRSQVRNALFSPEPLARVVVAEDDGSVVGLAAYSYLWPAAGATHSIFLKELFVREGARRTGIASSLFREIYREATARDDCSRVEWLADRDNDLARTFYENLGVPELGDKIVYRVRRDEFPRGQNPEPVGARRVSPQFLGEP